MSHDAEAIEKILTLARKDEIIEIDGRKFTTNKLHKVGVPTPANLKLHSLSGLLDYHRDSLTGKDVIFHIENEETVHIISQLDDATRDRECYVTSSLICSSFDFGYFMPVDDFIVALQSQFIVDDAVKNILLVVGNISQEAEHKTLDDGMSQTVTAKTGIATVGDVKVPNPVTLRPMRTFSEIEQPENLLIFRIKKGNDGPQCALFQADGGAWKKQAVESMKEYLNEGVGNDSAAGLEPGRGSVTVIG